jgi:hypothetical protein
VRLDVERVAWAALEHNYGAAADVPELLRGCGDPDASLAMDALEQLDDLLFHQGGWVCSAASAALPFLVELARDPAVVHRAVIVELIGRIAGEAISADPRSVDPGWPQALADVAPQMLGLLGDDDPRVRREAAWVAISGGLDVDEVAGALWRRWGEERDRVTRWDLVLAFGELLAGQGEMADVRAELVRLLDDDDLQVCLAAVHALAGSQPDLPAARVGMLVEAVRQDDAAWWQHSAWIGGTPGTIVHATARLLHQAPAVAAAFVLGASRGAESDQLVTELDEAGLLLAQWRTVTAAVLPFLADHLHDAQAEIRFRAAFLLGCLGRDAAPYVDQLAVLADDTAVRDSRRHLTVGDAALWALARQHDPRCLPRLRRRITGERSDLDTVSGAGVPGDLRSFPFQLPALAQTVTALRGHGGEFVAAVAARLAASSDRIVLSRWCDVLASWGADAGPAVPVLVRLLDDDAVWPAAAGALGAIGMQAAPAEQALRRRVRSDSDEPVGAWALWRVGGDPRPAVEALTRMIGDPARSQALRHLADLGPRAATAVASLEHLVLSSDEWVRIEAAHALFRVTQDPTKAVTALTQVIQPLRSGLYTPVMGTAMRYLAVIGGPATFPATPIAQAVVDNPRRLAHHGGWRAFVEDEELRITATALTST